MLICLFYILKRHINVFIDSIKQRPLMNDQILQFFVNRVQGMNGLDNFHYFLIPFLHQLVFQLLKPLLFQPVLLCALWKKLDFFVEMRPIVLLDLMLLRQLFLTIIT